MDVYLQALRDADIQYVVERDRWLQAAEIIEAAALVRAVLNPADHLALVTVLRSAVVGVPDGTLMPLWARGVLPALLTELHGPDAQPRLDEVEQGGERRRGGAAGWRAGDRARARLRNTLWLPLAGETLAELRESFERDPSVDFVERLRTATLLEATEAARPLGRFRVTNLERFFRRLLVHGEIGADVESMCARCRTAVAEQREGEGGATGGRGRGSGPRILTIHKAKGLDFDHVYLLQTHRGSRPDAGPGAARGAKLTDRLRGQHGARLVTPSGTSSPGGARGQPGPKLCGRSTSR